MLWLNKKVITCLTKCIEVTDGKWHASELLNDDTRVKMT